jgi:hypothetical protein
MYEEEIMAIGVMGVIIVLPLICGLIFFIQNVCINRRNTINRIEDTNNYSEI